MKMTIKEKLDFLVDEYKTLLEFKTLCRKDGDLLPLSFFDDYGIQLLNSCSFNSVANAVGAKIITRYIPDGYYTYEYGFYYRDVKFFIITDDSLYDNVDLTT